MIADAKATADMANIMSILNAQSSAETPIATGAVPTDYGMMDTPLAEGFDPNSGYDLSEGYNPYPENDGSSYTGPVGRVAIASSDTDAMKSILEAFHNAQAAPQEPARDPEVSEALRTERTSRGARIGSWEIVVNEGKTKTYDVVSADGHTTIAKGLYVYDAAYGITKRLNEGVAINDRRVGQLLALEEDFARNRDDASGYRERAKKLREKGEDLRASVAEDRHDEASRQALKAHEDILRLAGIRR
jgi:hypothetical protein